MLKYLCEVSNANLATELHSTYKQQNFCSKKSLYRLPKHYFKIMLITFKKSHSTYTLK